jgi:capsular polysaccharide export protein
MLKIVIVSTRLKSARGHGGLFPKLIELFSGEALHIDHAYILQEYKHLNKKGLMKLPDFITDQDITNAIRFSFERDKGRNPFRIKLIGAGHYQRKLENDARKYFKYLYYLYTSNPIQLVIVWNGSLSIVACASILAKKLGIKTLHMENGLLPGTITFDPEGVNYASELTNKTAEFYLGQDIDIDKMKQLSDTLWVTRAPRISKKSFTNDKPDLPAKYVFLPYQVHTDSQVIIHSDIHSMESLTELVLNAVEAYRKSTGEDLYLVTKEHPSDIGRINYSSFYKRYQNYHAKFLSYGNTEYLIENSKAIITLNSSVGLEAIFFRKPVITLGRAFYNIPGLVIHVDNPMELPQLLEKAFNFKVNEELISKFFYYLRYKYLVEFDKKDVHPEDIERVFNKTKTLINS